MIAIGWGILESDEKISSYRGKWSGFQSLVKPMVVKELKRRVESEDSGIIQPEDMKRGVAWAKMYAQQQILLANNVHVRKGPMNPPTVISIDNEQHLRDQVWALITYEAPPGQ